MVPDSTIVTRSVAKKERRDGRAGQAEIGIGKRGAIVFGSTVASQAKVAKAMGVHRHTVARILHNAYENAAENKENRDPLADENLQTKKRTGRPQRFGVTEREKVVQIATNDASARRKSFTLIARECSFKISNVTVARILDAAGYKQCIPREKPFLSEPNTQKRLAFALARVSKPIEGYWDGWIWTDEMSLIVGTHYGPERVLRRADEEYHPDCLNLKRPGETTVMFWGAIIYGIPPSECPFFIWEKETEEEKVEAEAILKEENKEIEKRNEMGREEMERRIAAGEYYPPNWVNPDGSKKRGRKPDPFREFKEAKKRRSKNRKGGIDWFRYREQVLKPLLYPFYDRIKQERPYVQLMEDGASPHRAKALNDFRHSRQINKVDWPSCMTPSIFLKT